MRFWNHHFRRYGNSESICMTCGYVIGNCTESEAKDWMRKHNGEEWWCGGAWHQFDRRQIALIGRFDTGGE